MQTIEPPPQVAGFNRHENPGTGAEAQHASPPATELTNKAAQAACSLQWMISRVPPGNATSNGSEGETGAPEEYKDLESILDELMTHGLRHKVSVKPGRYLLGVECDGATYHRAATARDRDRDKLRQAILEGLGWKLHRIWSTDWWHDSDKEMETLRMALSGLQRE